MVLDMTGSTVLEEIDGLKRELDALRPLPPDVVGRIGQKLRLEWNYHSNALEGNSLTLGETKSLILHGLTAQGKPMRDHLDIAGHDEAVKAMEEAVASNQALTQVFIRNLHQVLLKEPYENDAVTPDGRHVRRRIAIGAYKVQPNNVRTSTGETYYFTPPDQVQSAMGDLVEWYRKSEDKGEHPVVIAATFHYRFVRIHPFDDGNGRMARLLMNMILIRHGYTVALIPTEEKDHYIGTLERADKSEDLAEFIAYIAACCRYALNLHLRAARGEDIEEVEDIDKEIALFKKSLHTSPGGMVHAREYAATVLYPLFSHCQEKIEQLSDQFTSTDARESASVTKEDNTVASCGLSKDSRDWPQSALALSVTIRLRLGGLRGQGGKFFYFVITNTADSNRCAWRFTVSDVAAAPLHEKDYMGQDLDVLKKLFNETLRAMMEELSKASPDS